MKGCGVSFWRNSNRMLCAPTTLCPSCLDGFQIGHGREVPCSPEGLPAFLAAEVRAERSITGHCNQSVTVGPGLAALCGSGAVRCSSCRAAEVTSRNITKAGVVMTKVSASERLEGCRRRRANYIVYLKDRIEDEDWHGGSDACNDLRELDAEIRELEDRA